MYAQGMASQSSRIWWILCSSLSRPLNTLYLRRVVHPLMDLIRQVGATYTWAHPFSVKVTRDTNKFVLSNPGQLSDCFLFSEQDLWTRPDQFSKWIGPSRGLPKDFRPQPSFTTSQTSKIQVNVFWSQAASSYFSWGVLHAFWFGYPILCEVVTPVTSDFWQIRNATHSPVHPQLM